MPPLVIPNTVQVVLEWDTGEELHRNVLHATKGVGYTVTQASTDNLNQGVLNAILADPPGAAGPYQNEVLGSQAFYVGLVQTDISVEGGPQFHSTDPTSLGGLAGELMPRDVAIAVTLRTALRTRRGRGRVYLPGIGQDANDVGLIIADAQVAAAFFLQRLQVEWNGSGIVLGVASRVDLATRPVTAIEVRDSRFDTQRRRDIV